MDKNAQLEARVWSRIMGQKLEVPMENCEISTFLSSEYADLSLYRSLMKKLPCHREQLCCLIHLAEENIKYLKTMYYVEKAVCYERKNPENIYICNICDALRQQIKKVQNMRQTYENGGNIWEIPACNKKKEGRILVGILQMVM